MNKKSSEKTSAGGIDRKQNQKGFRGAAEGGCRHTTSQRQALSAVGSVGRPSLGRARAESERQRVVVSGGACVDVRM